MRILVTGGTGFTGTHLVRRLLADGHDVVALDLTPGDFGDELVAAGARLELASVTERERVCAATEGAELVFHVAAAFRDLTQSRDEYREVNVEGTRNVLAAAQAHGVRRVVYCSTIGVHGDVRDPPADEDAPIEPADHYQHTKWEGELVCREFLERGLDVSIVRPAAIYGPGDPGRFLLLFKMVKKGWFPMLGDGEVPYHPVYADNLVDLFLLAAEKPEARGRAYIGADEECCTLNELVTAVARAMDTNVRRVRLPYWPVWLAALATEAVCKPLGISPPLFRRRIHWYRQVRAFDIERARRELGYRPRVGLDEGLRRTFRWYREHGYV